ncbi:MAG: nitroreductase family protein, partial [Dehalococcoidia bacterium]|nr:nitroreductase family protein [Dehalococcoidia bacterium]
VRKFKPDPVPDEYIEKILDAARWAMSGANGQPWEFIVVKDKATIKKLAELHAANNKRNYVIESTRVPEMRHPSYLKPSEGLPGFVNAPVLIMVCADPRVLQASTIPFHFYGGGEGGPLGTYYKNIANCTQYIHLAAAALGLGSQWASVNNSWEPQIRRLLEIPDVISVHTIVPIGYPDYKVPPPYRRKLQEMVHYEKYDQSKYRTEEDIRDYIMELRRKTVQSYDVKDK